VTNPQPGQWTPKTAALRDLILLMVHQQGGIVDGTGRVASRIREYFTIPDSKTNNTCISEVLGLMAQDKLIVRRMDERRTRTYGVELTSPLSEVDVRQLEEAREDNLVMLIGGKTDGEISLTQLTRQCQQGYRELQEAAKRSLRRDTSGRVAINATGVLKAIGISGETARRIRYYLKELGLIRSHTKCDDTDAQLWWWTISDDPIDSGKLRNLASGEHSFENNQERQRRSRTGTPEASPVVVRKIDDSQAAPVTSDATVDTTVVRPAAAKPAPPRERSSGQVVAAETRSADDPVEALLVIIGRLEGRLEEQTEIHRKELEAKDGEIVELREQLAARQAVDDRAAAVIARFSGK